MKSSVYEVSYSAHLLLLSLLGAQNRDDLPVPKSGLEEHPQENGCGSSKLP